MIVRVSRSVLAPALALVACGGAAPPAAPRAPAPAVAPAPAPKGGPLAELRRLLPAATPTWIRDELPLEVRTAIPSDASPAKALELARARSGPIVFDAATPDVLAERLRDRLVAIALAEAAARAAEPDVAVAAHAFLVSAIGQAVDGVATWDVLRVSASTFGPDARARLAGIEPLLRFRARFVELGGPAIGFHVAAVLAGDPKPEALEPVLRWMMVRSKLPVADAAADAFIATHRGPPALEDLVLLAQVRAPSERAGAFDAALAEARRAVSSLPAEAQRTHLASLARSEAKHAVHARLRALDAAGPPRTLAGAIERVDLLFATGRSAEMPDALAALERQAPADGAVRARVAFHRAFRPNVAERGVNGAATLALAELDRVPVTTNPAEAARFRVGLEGVLATGRLAAAPDPMAGAAAEARRLGALVTRLAADDPEGLAPLVVTLPRLERVLSSSAELSTEARERLAREVLTELAPLRARYPSSVALARLSYLARASAPDPARELEALLAEPPPARDGTSALPLLRASCLVRLLASVASPTVALVRRVEGEVVALPPALPELEDERVVLLADVASIAAVVAPSKEAWTTAAAALETAFPRGKKQVGRLANNLAFARLALGGAADARRDELRRAVELAGQAADVGRLLAAFNAVETLGEADRRAAVAELASQLEKQGDDTDRSLFARWRGTPDAAPRRAASRGFVPHPSLPMVVERVNTIGLNLSTEEATFLLDASARGAVWLTRAKLLSEAEMERGSPKRR